MTPLSQVVIILITTLSTFSSFSQIKQISYQEIELGSDIFFEATMDQASSEITLTMDGPSDRWYGIGFGLNMSNADVLLYTDGKVGSMHAEGAWDYNLNAQNAAGVAKDSQDDWTLISNTVNGNVRTIVASRFLNTGDISDHVLNYVDATIDIIWGKGNTSDMTLAYHGAANRGATTLTWEEVDVTSPDLTINPFSPGDNSTDVSLTTNLLVEFDENIQLGAGIIELRLANNTVVESFDVTSSPLVQTSGNQLTIDPSTILSSLTDYYVTIESGAVLDVALNAYTGFSDNSTWNFTTLDNSGDVTAPSLALGPFDPADNAINVDPTQNLSITFDEDIIVGAGTFTIYEMSTGSVFEAIDVQMNLVNASGQTATINPTNDLQPNTQYYVAVDSDCFYDVAMNAFTGFSDTTTWNFTTESVSIPELENNFNIVLKNRELTVQNKSGKSYDLRIVNSEGRVAFMQIGQENDSTFDVSAFAPGMLFVQIVGENDSFVKIVSNL